MAPTQVQDGTHGTGSVRHSSAQPSLQPVRGTAGTDGPGGNGIQGGHHGPLRRAGAPSRTVAGMPAGSWAPSRASPATQHRLTPRRAPPYPQHRHRQHLPSRPGLAEAGPASHLLPKGSREDISGLATGFRWLLQAPGEQLGAAPACLGSALPEPKGGITAEATGSAAASVATEDEALSCDVPTRASALGSGDPCRSSQHWREAAPHRSTGGPASPRHKAEGTEPCLAGSYPGLLPSQHTAIPQESPRRLLWEPLLLGRS